MLLNNKGFTLFTALVSLILVSISLSLVFNMVSTEETYLSLIQDQSSYSDLITMSDLAKADAFNTFLISLRSRWEEFQLKNSMTITRKDLEQNWPQFTDNFVKDRFFEKQFAGFFAQALYFHLSYNTNPVGYAITVNKEGVGSENNGEFSSNNFNEIIEKMFEDGGKKVDVVDCDQESDECVGSFYLTLDTTHLDDQEYESLPSITILRLKNNQVIQKPILNRQIYKIYIPWRGFQAIRTIRKLTLGSAEKEDTPVISQSYNGLFDPEKHNILEQARLGFCEPKTCAPRPGFFTTPSSTGFNDKCDNPPIINLNSSVPSLLNFSVFSGSYNPTDTTQIKNIFTTFYKAFLENNVPSNVIYNNTGLEITGTERIPNTDIKYISLSLDVDSKETKTLIENSNVSVTNYTPKTFNSLSDISSVSGGLGLFLKDNKSKYIWEYNNDWYKAHENKNVPPTNLSSQPPKFSCNEIKEATIDFSFIETNPKYYIKEEYEGEPVTINLKLQHDFTGFYFPPSTSWQGLSTSGKFLLGTPGDLDSDFQKDWTCYSWSDTDKRCGIPN